MNMVCHLDVYGGGNDYHHHVHYLNRGSSDNGDDNEVKIDASEGVVGVGRGELEPGEVDEARENQFENCVREQIKKEINRKK